MRQCQGLGRADPARRVWAAAHDSSPPLTLLLRDVGRGLLCFELLGFHSEFLAYISGSLLRLGLGAAFGLVAVALALLLVLAVAQCLVYVRFLYRSVWLSSSAVCAGEILAATENGSGILQSSHSEEVNRNHPSHLQYLYCR